MASVCVGECVRIWVYVHYACVRVRVRMGLYAPYLLVRVCERMCVRARVLEGYALVLSYMC